MHELELEVILSPQKAAKAGADSLEYGLLKEYEPDRDRILEHVFGCGLLAGEVLITGSVPAAMLTQVRLARWHEDGQ